jgi:predicted nicotinamide N-methyase
LARFILDHSSEFEGATVLDLGCGSGLVGLAAKRAGARTVTCADTDGFACLAVDLNAKANGLDVETSEEDPTGTWTRFVDVIVAGDVCYEPAMAEKHLAWLGAQAKKGTRVFLGDPGRAYGPSNASVGPWSDLVERKRYGVPVVEDLESVPVKQTSVWQWRIGP